MINKVVERCIYNRINQFLNRNKFFYRLQYGFRKGMGTKTATTNIINRILCELDDRKSVAGIFMDLSKAFDCVPQDMLLFKMERAGIRGAALALMQDYFRLRKIVVEVDGELSDEREVTIGVGQGSIIGPLLYLIFVNDIGSLPLKGELSLFADDTAVFYFGQNREQNQAHINHDLRVLDSFYRINKLTMNIPKTQYINFSETGHAASREEGQITMKDTIIRETTTIKYLGLFIDNKLNWKKHTEETAKKISGPIGIIAKLSGFMPTSVLRMIYHSLVHSHLSYLTLLWASAKRVNRRPLEVLQNRAVKKCQKLRMRHNTADAYKRARILPLRGISNMQTLECVITNIREHQDCSRPSFEFPVTTRPRRGPQLLRIPKVKGGYGQASLNHRGATLYNKLPDATRNNIHKQKPKKYMKEYLMNDQNLLSIVY